MTIPKKQEPYIINADGCAFYTANGFLFYRDDCAVALTAIGAIVPITHYDKKVDEDFPAIQLAFASGSYNPIFFVFKEREGRDLALEQLFRDIQEFPSTPL